MCGSDNLQVPTRYPSATGVAVTIGGCSSISETFVIDIRVLLVHQRHLFAGVVAVYRDGGLGHNCERYMGKALVP